MTGHPDESKCGVSRPERKETFDAETDYAAYVYFEISGIETGDTILEQWYYEDDLYAQTHHTTNRSGFNCMWDPLIIRGSDTAYLTGNWSVDFYYNDEKSFTETFFISGIPKPFAVVSHIMTNTTDNCTCGEEMPPEITVFDSEKDERIVLYVELEGVRDGDNSTVRWYGPDTMLYLEEKRTYDESGYLCDYNEIILQDTAAVYMTGDWHVEFYWNGTKEVVETFYLDGIPYPGICALEYLAGDDRKGITALRKFRDTVLTNTACGKRVIRLYYQYAPYAIKILEKYPHVRTFLKKWLIDIVAE